MQLMLAQDEPQDYVVGTGVTHSASRNWSTWPSAWPAWTGATTSSPDAAFVRPAEVDRLCADPAKAAQELGWEPKIGFEELVAMMVESDLELLSSSPGGHDDDSFGADPW